jgi:Helix-turn-helix domain
VEVGQEFEKYTEPSASGDEKQHEAPQTQTASKPPSKGKGKPPKRKRAFHPFATFNAFRDYGANKAGLSPSQRFVWVVIWSHIDAQSGLARISYQTLAEKCGLQERQTKNVVASLLELGFLEVVQKGSAIGRTSNAYRVFSAPSENVSSAL